MKQLDLFGTPEIEIKNKIRLIELFGGIGSQAMALRDLGVDFEHYRLVEFDKYPVASYNAVHGTNFVPTDITKIHAEDLGIVETDKYTYIMTYSFPCQDLSLAGKRRGMTKGSGTRSGLLWEVERLLTETEHLPQVLLMENVPQVISEKNIDDFRDWIVFLNKKGYSNHYKILNAKDYGVAQNRERCFMVSLLGNFDYEFPETEKLTKTVKDYLEDEVDEKYYINNEKARKLIKDLVERGELPYESSYKYQYPGRLDKVTGAENGKFKKPTVRLRNEYVNTITARYWKGIAGSGDNLVVEKEETK